MNGRQRIVFLSAAALAAIVATGGAQPRGAWLPPPEVGYVWPAGGQAGTTVEVTVGGQSLANVEQVLLSGSGVQAEAVGFTRPPNGKEIAAVRDVLQQAAKGLQAQRTGGRRPPLRAVLRRALELGKEKGVTEEDIRAVQAFNRQRSDPKRQLNPQLSQAVTVRITLAPDAEPGVRELRLLTPSGLSNPLRFCVGELPELLESEPNDDPAGASAAVDLPAVLNGQILPGDVDCFRFRARRGQGIVARVRARELVPYLADAVPGWFQAVVTLYDEQGREVAYADDYRFDPDPVLRFEIPADGEYVLAIRDSIYRGREDFVYRVQLGELPFIAGVSPIGGRQGQQVTVSLEGWNLPADQVQRQVGLAAASELLLQVQGPGGPSNAVPFAVDALSECRETPAEAGAPGDAGEAKPQALALPCIVNGCIGRAGDWDVFRFQGRRGDRIVAEVTARRLGSPLDSVLKLTDAAGRTLAINDDHRDRSHDLLTHHADSLLLATLPNAGEYRLWLGDVQAHGGPEFRYRLRVGPPREDFQLRVTPSAVNARAGQTVPITVYALRRDGFAGPIELRLKDAPAGFKLAGWLPSGADRARMTLTVPARPGPQLTTLHLEGHAEIAGRDVVREAQPADDRMQAFIYHHLVLAERWIASVTPAGWNRGNWMTIPSGGVSFQAGKTVSFAVRMPPRAPKGRIRLELDDPPPGVEIRAVKVVPEGLAVALGTDADQLQPGQTGNLIIKAFLDRAPASSQPARQQQRVALGVLPAIPFRILQQ